MIMFRFDVLQAKTVREIKTAVKATLAVKYGDKLPSGKGGFILIKPNLNSNMNALTGNTTDLRLLAGVIESLKDEGYSNIAIGEGTNSGFYRSGINVISRLKIDELARRYGVRIIDFNYSGKVDVRFENGITAHVARECVEAELFINMPKIKTHFEAGMSVCLKNMMGCLVGQENKKKTHQSLAANILNLNTFLKPQLHIVDGVISMEGLGPTRGTPLLTGAIFIGDNPYVIDMVAARLASTDYRSVRTLAEAEKRGLLTEEMKRFAEGVALPRVFSFAPPKAGPIASFIHHPGRQKYFLAIRNTAFFDKVCSMEIVGKLLFATGLRQDVFIQDEMSVEKLHADTSKCGSCPQKCADYCPVDLDLPGALKGPIHEKCVSCMYCYLVCPNGAISFTGKAGFLDEQLRQYGNIVRKMV